MEKRIYLETTIGQVRGKFYQTRTPDHVLDFVLDLPEFEKNYLKPDPLENKLQYWMLAASSRAT